MPQHSSSPPPPGDDDEGPASEDDEFRNLGRFPVGAEGSDIASLESASKLTKLSPTLNPTTSQSIGSIYHQSEQSQITSTVSLSPISDQTELVDIHSSLHLQNEFSDAGIDRSASNSNASDERQTPTESNQMRRCSAQTLFYSHLFLLHKAGMSQNILYNL